MNENSPKNDEPSIIEKSDAPKDLVPLWLIAVGVGLAIWGIIYLFLYW